MLCLMSQQQYFANKIGTLVITIRLSKNVGVVNRVLHLKFCCLYFCLLVHGEKEFVALAKRFVNIATANQNCCGDKLNCYNNMNCYHNNYSCHRN